MVGSILSEEGYEEDPVTLAEIARAVDSMGLRGLVFHIAAVCHNRASEHAQNNELALASEWEIAERDFIRLGRRMRVLR